MAGGTRSCAIPAVETLGSTSVVCTDKTGTLTRNEMVVCRAWTPRGDEAEFEGVGYAAAGRMVIRPGDGGAGVLRRLLTAGALANEAHLDDGGGGRTVLGDPTDGALLVAAERAGIDLADLFDRHPPGVVLPFDSARQYMASAPVSADEAAGPTYLKGAPEVLLGHVDPNVAAAAHAVLDGYAADGLRVLAVAVRSGRAVDAPLDHDIRLLGLVGLIDPPREEVVEAVATCQRAGVAVKMITGDHAATAAAIGRELGIVGQAPPMTGSEIAASSDEELRARVLVTDVFARVAPEHKLRPVRALQAGGAVTAMTGDGVNDAPALRQADIGVAMGRAGTAAAKEAADIVLGDDNFATIRAAIEEGRRVFYLLVCRTLTAPQRRIGWTSKPVRVRRDRCAAGAPGGLRAPARHAGAVPHRRPDRDGLAPRRRGRCRGDPRGERGKGVAAPVLRSAPREQVEPRGGSVGNPSPGHLTRRPSRWPAAPSRRGHRAACGAVGAAAGPVIVNDRGTIVTGHVLSFTSAWLAEPSTAPAIAPRPRVATTMRAWFAPPSSASITSP
jgi:soluble P-type ATPase